jgi:arginine-tRNA-protein transferase
MEIRSGTGSEASSPRPDADPAAALERLAPLHHFFATASVPCPYVEGRAERKVIIELPDGEAALLYNTLSRAGFRRSHRFAYRPACRACQACVPVRISVEQFRHSRSTRRVRNLNRNVAARLAAPRATVEQFRLFATYQRSRHRDSDMAAMSFADYRSMIEDTPLPTAVAEFRDETGQLLAASLVDRLDDGLSAVYSFFDPALEKRSLGTWSILWLVEECRRRGLAYVYLGYWIGESPKMAYKSRFPALERLTQGSWVPFSARP